MTEQQINEAARMYREDLLPLSAIAEHFEVSRQYIHQVLRKYGVDTRKRRYPVKCYTCGKVVLRARWAIRRAERHFCSVQCRSLAG